MGRRASDGYTCCVLLAGGIEGQSVLLSSMMMVELALTSLAEVPSTAILEAHDSQGFIELQRDASQVGGIVGNARRYIEAATGQPVVLPLRSKQRRRERQRELQRPLLDMPDGQE